MGVGPTEIKAVVLEVVGEVLQQQVRKTDDFLDLGGYSFLAVQVAQAVEQRVATSLGPVADSSAPDALRRG
ncbi:phosphopantetheine-binding protein [Micromonospora chokoriensis]